MTDPSQYGPEVARVVDVLDTYDRPDDVQLVLESIELHPTGCGIPVLVAHTGPCPYPSAPHVTGAPREPEGHCHTTKFTDHVRSVLIDPRGWLDLFVPSVLRLHRRDLRDLHREWASVHN